MKEKDYKKLQVMLNDCENIILNSFELTDKDELMKKLVDVSDSLFEQKNVLIKERN